MTRDRYDIVVTWPKTKPLQAYLDELKRAEHQGLDINYRVARLPEWPDYHIRVASWPVVRRKDGERYPRCYMVHDGAIRGYCEVHGATYRKVGEVDGWPAGLYIVRSPVWHPLESPIPMPGFRGWRWMKHGVAAA